MAAFNRVHIDGGSDVGNIVDGLLREKLDEQKEELEAKHDREQNDLLDRIHELEVEILDLKGEIEGLKSAEAVP